MAIATLLWPELPPPPVLTTALEAAVSVITELAPLLGVGDLNNNTIKHKYKVYDTR